MTTTEAPPGVELLDIPLDLIVDHPDNIRIELGDLTELSASIERVGISVPLLVLPANPDGLHYLIDGHRRLHAARSTPSLRPAPCLVRDLTEAQVVETMLVTGLRRREISPLEEARGYQRLIELDTKLADIANAVGATQKHVKARLALLQLPEALLQMVHTGRVTIATATEILKFAADEDALAHAVEFVTRTPDAHSLPFSNEVTNYVSGRDRKRALADARAQLEADGIGEYSRVYWVPPERLTGLHDVVAVTALKLTAAQTRKHAGDPCHKAHVAEENHYRDGATTWDVVVTPVCTRPEYHTAEFEDSPSKLQMKPDTYKHLLDKKDPNAKPAPLGDPDVAARSQASIARCTLRGTLYRGDLTALIPMEPLVAAQMLELLTEWDYESAIAQSLIEAFPDDGEDLGPEMYTWPTEHLAAAVVLERLEDIWRRHTPTVSLFRAYMVTAVEESAAVEYLDLLQKAGHKLSRIERADLKALQGRIAARTEEAAAEAAEAKRRTDEEQNPTADIARARFDEAGPDALGALAELVIHEDSPASPYPVLDDEDALRDLEVAGLGNWADTDDGKVFRTTDFARSCLALVPDALDGAIEGDPDVAARSQASIARCTLRGTLYRGDLTALIPMEPLVAAQMLELLTEWDYESAIAQSLIEAFPDDGEDLGPEMYTWPTEHLAAAVVLEGLEDIWRRHTPTAFHLGEYMVTAVEESAAVEYLDLLQKAGHKLSRIERADLKALQGRIAEAKRRTDEEQNPTADIARARFDEAGPDALGALAELVIHEDSPASPYPVLDDEDALRDLEVAGLGNWADTDDGKVFRTTDFARSCLALVPDALDGAIEGIGALA